MLKRKLLVALLGVGIVMDASASATTKSSTISFDNPDFRPVTVNVAALWLKPGASNLNYVIYNKELPTQSPSWAEQEVKTNFAPAFEVGATIRPRSMEDVDFHLDWTHLRSTDSNSISADNVSYFLGPDYQIGPLGIPIRNAKGTAKFSYDVVNLDAGKTIHYGEALDVRLFGGLSSGLLQENVIADYSGVTTGVFAGPFNFQQSVSSKFAGIGPRVGLSADVHCKSGFGIVGEAAATALIGANASNTNYNASAAELLALYGQQTNQQSITDQNVYQVVPGFDARLGVDYHYTFANNAMLAVTLGYQAAVYINAISQYVPQSTVLGEGIETGGLFVATMSHTLSNYSVQGPFLDFAVSV